MFVCLTGPVVYELLSIPFCWLTCYFLKNGFHGKIGRDGQVCVDSFCDLKRHLWSPLNYFYSSESKTASLAWLRLCLENGSRKYRVCDQGDCWTKFPVGELLLMWLLPSFGDLGDSQGCVPVSYCSPGLRTGRGPLTLEMEWYPGRSITDIMSAQWIYLASAHG